jgi:hypothetical protein
MPIGLPIPMGPMNWALDWVENSKPDPIRIDATTMVLFMTAPTVRNKSSGSVKRAANEGENYVATTVQISGI